MEDLERFDCRNIEENSSDSSSDSSDEFSTAEEQTSTDIEDDSLGDAPAERVVVLVEETSGSENHSSVYPVVSVSDSKDDSSDSSVPPLVSVSSSSSDTESDTESVSGESEFQIEWRVNNQRLSKFRKKRFKDGAQFRDLPDGLHIYRERHFVVLG